MAKITKELSMGNFEKMKEEYLNVTKQGGSPEEQEKAFNNMFSALSKDLSETIKKEAQREMMDHSVLQARNASNVLTTEEYEFFNAVALSGGFDNDQVLPRTTVDRVFEQLQEQFPFLSTLNIQNLGAVTRFIDSDPTKAYACGNLFEGILGQVSTVFRERIVPSHKLTAFAAIPNDMLELGPNYIERYVRTLLVQSYSTGLEQGMINGRGIASKEPIGLTMDVDPLTGAVTPKVSAGTLTFAPSQFGETVVGELHQVVQFLSTDALGNSVDTNNNIVMVVNPTDYVSVMARNTIQTQTGSFVNNLPFGITPVQSRAVTAGTAVFFNPNRYTASLVGGVQIKKFDQTLAIEDATLYTLKQIAYGEPRDNKAAVVYDLNITFTP